MEDYKIQRNGKCLIDACIIMYVIKSSARGDCTIGGRGMGYYGYVIDVNTSSAPCSGHDESGEAERRRGGEGGEGGGQLNPNERQPCRIEPSSRAIEPSQSRKPQR
jgi:hypothetical protein